MRQITYRVPSNHETITRCCFTVGPASQTKLSGLNSHPLEVVSRYRGPQVQVCEHYSYLFHLGGAPRVVVSTAAFHARVRGRFPISAV